MTSGDPGSLSHLIEEAQTLSSRAIDDAASAQALTDLLKTLQTYQVTTQLLVETQAGKKIRKLTKHSNAAVSQAAAAAVAAWKEAVKQEVGAANGEPSSQLEQDASQSLLLEGDSAHRGSQPGASAAACKAQLPPPAKRQKSVGLGVANGAGSPTISGMAQAPGGANSRGHAAALQPPAPSSNAATAKSAVIPKTGDPARDKTRQLFAEALVLAQADVVDADVGAAAADVEGAMHRQSGGVNAKYKTKYRSLIFNLRDANNPDLRRRVLSREIPGEVLVELPAEELASDARRSENAAIRKTALFEAERGQHMKQATTDQFQCGKCKQRKCQYYQMQTRSADEPMTTFVTCTNCGNRWKFC